MNEENIFFTRKMWVKKTALAHLMNISRECDFFEWYFDRMKTRLSRHRIKLFCWTTYDSIEVKLFRDSCLKLKWDHLFLSQVRIEKKDLIMKLFRRAEQKASYEKSKNLNCVSGKSTWVGWARCWWTLLRFKWGEGYLFVWIRACMYKYFM